MKFVSEYKVGHCSMFSCKYCLAEFVIKMIQRTGISLWFNSRARPKCEKKLFFQNSGKYRCYFIPLPGKCDDISQYTGPSGVVFHICWYITF